MNEVPMFLRKQAPADPAPQPAPPGLPRDYDGRKGFPLLTFLTAYFPDAIEALVRLSIQGNVQHSISTPAEQPFFLPTDRIAWDRAKSTEELETLMRHLWDHTRAKRGVGDLFDTDGHLHIVKALWRAGTEAQRTIERLRLMDGTQPTERAFTGSYGGTT